MARKAKAATTTTKCSEKAVSKTKQSKKSKTEEVVGNKKPTNVVVTPSKEDNATFPDKPKFYLMNYVSKEWIPFETKDEGDKVLEASISLDPEMSKYMKVQCFDSDGDAIDHIKLVSTILHIDTKTRQCKSSC